jgi:hypothetical protein
VLLSLRPYVDIVLPGLDVSSPEPNGHQPVFIDSQDEMDAESPTRPAVKATPPIDRRSSSRRLRSNTPGSVRLSVPNQATGQSTPSVSRLKATRRSATPRLRHDNSQIQFAAIESSSPVHIVEESQLLTERQKEVKERQQENAALFPEIRSSIEKLNNGYQGLEMTSNGDMARSEKAVTPKSQRSFEDYVSSTPTPRRGQTTLIGDNDHEMTDDIPSSPPDPRRFPLIPDISKLQSSSSSVLDEWQFTSSPVSGSPRLDRSAIPNEQATNLDGNGESRTAMPIMEGAERVSQNLFDDEGDNADIEDEGRDVHMGEAESVLPPVTERPTTPPNLRNVKAQETPRSDNEVFVDALTSPVAQTPRARRALARAAQTATMHEIIASQPKDRSFDASDVDEHSLMRLADELDSHKSEPLLAVLGKETTSKDGQLISAQSQGGSPSFECITVHSELNRSSRRSKRSKRGTSSFPVVSSTSIESNPSQETGKKHRKKRKRTVDASQEPGSAKRGRSQEQDGNSEAEPESQQYQAIDGKHCTQFVTAKMTN